MRKRLRNKSRIVLEALEQRRLLAVDFGVNLLQNPGAQNGLAGWNTSSNLTQVKAYGESDTPTESNGPQVGGVFSGGSGLFYGGDAQTTSSGDTTTTRRCSATGCAISQDFFFAGQESLVDQGILYADMSAWLGGFASQNDRTIYNVQWKDGNLDVIGVRDELLAVTNVDRGNVTSMLYREDTFPVPIGTRMATVELQFLRAAGDDNDATADNVEFLVRAGEAHGDIGGPDCPITTSSAVLELSGSLDIDTNVTPLPPCASISGPVSITFGNGGAGESLSVGAGALIIDTSVALDGPLTLFPAPSAASSSFPPIVSFQNDIGPSNTNPMTLLISVPEGGLGLTQSSQTIGAVFSSSTEIDRVHVTVSGGAAVFNDGAVPQNDARIVVLDGGLVMGKGFAESASGTNGEYFIAGELVTDDGLDAHTSGDLTLTSTAVHKVTMNVSNTVGDVAGIAAANGTVGIQGASLQFLDNSSQPPGRVIEIITNDGSDSVSGTYAGLPEGMAFDSGLGRRYHISYQGGDGNDVIVRRNRYPVGLESGSTPEDTLLSGNVQIEDPDGDSVSATLVTGPTHAESFSFNSDGTFSYQPNLHFSGSDSFVYQVDDGELAENFEFTVEVVPIADAPVFTTAEITPEVGEGEWLALNLATSLVDTDGSEVLQPLLVEGVPAGVVLSHGTNSGDGSWLVPVADVASLELESPDNQTFTLTLTSTAAEQANGDTASTSITIDVTVNGVAPTLTVSDQIAGSELLRNITNVVTFTDPGYVNSAAGTDEQFTYSIDWGDGTTPDTGTATVDVAGSLPTAGTASPLTKGSFDGSHTYAADGRYNVTVTVTDDDGDSTSETFEVWVMIRLLDVTYSDDQVQLEFTDPIDPTHATNDTIRVMGSQSGLLNDTTTSPQVADEIVTINFLHGGFAGEELTIILPADRDELNRSGVWSTDDSPIYQPEIDTYRVPTSGGTGKWINTEVFDSVDADGIGFSLEFPWLTPGFAADINRDGMLDTLWPGGTTIRQASNLGWELLKSDELLIDDLLAADTNGDGILERIDIEDPGDVGVHIADFDLDGELEEFRASRFGNWTLDNFERFGAPENPFGTSSIPGLGSYIELFPDDFDGDGDVDVFIHSIFFQYRLWLCLA